MGNQRADSSWREVVKKYNKPDLRRSIWQLVNTLVPYILLWYLMYLSLEISYLITLGLSVLAAGFLVRAFIIFHDCGHGSFFKSARANRIVGTILGSLVFTPYDRWHQNHAKHHATVGNLDRRGVGDVWTLTVDEYLKLPRKKKIIYRTYRHPIILLVIGPILLFVLSFRFTKKDMNRLERRSIYLSNLFMLIYVGALMLLLGWKAFLLIQLPVIYMASTAGVWLFYVQHQYEGVIWARNKEWEYSKIALEGSSFLKFPKILQWFSGNIGFHHIHHLSPMIPNYNLEKCHRGNKMFKTINPVTFIPSLRTLKLRLWDERRGLLVSFRDIRSYYPA